MFGSITVYIVAIAGLAVAFSIWLIYVGKLRALSKMARYAPPSTACRHEFDEQLKDAGRCFFYWLCWLTVLIATVSFGFILADVVQTPVMFIAVSALYIIIFVCWLKLWITAKIRERQRHYFAYMDQHGWIDDAIAE